MVAGHLDAISVRNAFRSQQHRRQSSRCRPPCGLDERWLLGDISARAHDIWVSSPVHALPEVDRPCLVCREALRAYSSTIDEDLRLLGDKAELAPDSVEHKAVLVRLQRSPRCSRQTSGAAQMLAWAPVTHFGFLPGRQSTSECSPRTHSEPHLSPRTEGRSSLPQQPSPTVTLASPCRWAGAVGEKEALDSTLRFFEDRASRLDGLEYYQERRLKRLGLMDDNGGSTYNDFFKDGVA